MLYGKFQSIAGTIRHGFPYSLFSVSIVQKIHKNIANHDCFPHLENRMTLSGSLPAHTSYMDYPFSRTVVTLPISQRILHAGCSTDTFRCVGVRFVHSRLQLASTFCSQLLRNCKPLSLLQKIKKLELFQSFSALNCRHPDEIIFHLFHEKLFNRHHIIIIIKDNISAVSQI